MKKWISMMIASFLIVVFAMTVPAATKTVKNVSAGTSYSVANKKATIVKKGKVTLNIRRGFLKFTAPKKKTYTFKFKTLKSTGFMPYVDCMKKSGKELTMYNKMKLGKDSGVGYFYLPLKGYTQTVKISLKKGQTIFFYLGYDSGSENAKMKVKLTIS